MTDELIAYLLNDLPDDRKAEVESQLAADPKWREELARLQDCLGESSGEDCSDSAEQPPPGDLVNRTCTLVDSVCGPPASLSPTTERCCSRSKWTLADVSVAVGIVLILSALVLPAIRGSRDSARRVACQDNLRTLGTALFDYAQARNGQLPSVGPNENAGTFAVKLAAAGYLQPQQLGESLVCPQSALAGESGKRRVLVRVLSSRDDKGDPKLKIQMWPLMSGSYAYRLGYFDKHGEYRQVKFTGSHNAPMLADAPSFTNAKFRSLNHGNGGYNVIFQDLSSRFVIECDLNCSGEGLDDPFLNDNRAHAAGLCRRDVVLGRSEWTPLGPLSPVTQSVAARSSMPMMLYFSGLNSSNKQD
ncbi:type II secretion system protein [Adhaeretor mobilis]|uniref:DUF1559 domain-containing protein n=1 Tax=Adhaeretor mobilis TaxID=1930276 RepID=A0A517N2P9_9BACT|nr:type II secretion system protein [Adhaeretor mobilis]QDT01420.1 hypothetical protein HG15A2_47620 [Adhaeretor mobilis]